MLQAVLLYLIGGMLLVYCGNKLSGDCLEMWQNGSLRDRISLVLLAIPVFIYYIIFPSDD